MTADERVLHGRVHDLAPARDPLAALTLGDEARPAMQDRAANPWDAETCRLLSLCGAAIGDLEATWTWRTRALHRFAVLGWSEGVAAVMLSNAFSALREANDDYRRGRTLDVVRGSDVALRMLEEMEPFGADRDPDPRFAIGDRAPSPRLVRRWYWENRALFELLLGRHDAAESACMRAAEVALDARGALKVEAGRLLLEVLRGTAGSADDAIMRFTGLRARAAAFGAVDLVEVIDHDVDVLRRGGRDLLPFAIL